MNRPRSSWAVTLGLFLFLLGGCASGSNAISRADAHARVGEWDSALRYYQQVLEEDPGNRTARAKLQLAKTSASQFHRVEGNRLSAAGDLQRAQLELELAVRLDPTNQRAVTDLRHANEALIAAQAVQATRRTAIEQAIDRSMDYAAPVPELDHHALGMLTFDYRRARLKEVYRALARLGGVNVLFDPDIGNDATTFFLADVTYENALDTLAAMNGHFYRVMSPNTILIAPDNQQKRRQYAPQVMRTFYLSNANADQIAGTLQSILQARQVMANPTLNAVTIRDSAELVEVAARMVASLDKSVGEVLLQVEMFEVDRSVMDDYGLSLSDYGTTLSVAQDASGVALGALGSLTNQDAFLTIPSLRYQFLQQDSTFRLIAQPQLRASDGQLSSLLIGEQRPVVTTTFNPATNSGGDVIPISTTEYRDVGIVIEATPRVHHDGTITLQLRLEVTAVQDGAGALNQPVFTARTLNTTLRLQEGETNLLAGMLRDDERTSYEGLPILSQVPILRQLFGSTRTDVQQTDIVMSITPYIVRMADITDEDLAAVYVGTESAITGGQGQRRRRGGNDRGDEDVAEGQDEAEIQETINVRVEPSEQSGSVGQRLSIDILAQGSAEVNNAGLRVNWNPQILRYIDAQEGGMLSSDGAETSFASNTAAQGSVAVGVGRLGDVGGVPANGVIATLRFEVVGVGETPVQIISAALRDAAGRPLTVQFEQGFVRVDGN